METEYINGDVVPELFEFGDIDIQQVCEDDIPEDEQEILDTAGTIFDPDLHYDPEKLTAKGRFKKIPKSARKPEPQDIQITGDFILNIAKSFGASLSGNEDFKLKNDKNLDALFIKTIDEKMSTTSAVEFAEEKLPYLILFGIPAFYIYQGMQHNKPLAKKVKTRVKMVSLKPYLWLKEKFKRKKKDKKEASKMDEIDEMIVTEENIEEISEGK